MPAPGEPNPETDAALLKRARDGDQAAFGALMQTHYARVFRLVFAIVRHEHDARDISQEIWLKVWRELPHYRGEGKFTTWLHPIATRTALDHLRKRRRWFDRFLPFSTEDGDGGAPEPATTDDPGTESLATERSERLKHALDSLPPKHRTVLALRELEGLSYDEIAQATSLPTGTVMSRLYHARRHLAAKLKDTS